MFLVVLVVLFALSAVVYIFVRQRSFGKSATGERLVRIQQSPHYRDGKFQNLSPTPNLTEGVGYKAVLGELLFHRNKNSRPEHPLRTEKTDLQTLSLDRDVLIWFGHSSYFLQLDGKKMLVDPVLSGSASPIRALNRSFPGSDVYSAEELPDIDYLFISHDHWDHLDYTTLKQLRPKIGKVITGLGTGAHLEYWGFDPKIIVEKDWYEQVILADGFVVNILPARHFSGRGMHRNRTLWVSFALETPTMKLFLGGDGGYDRHFAKIGQQHGPFDLAILECGQYHKHWKYIHLTPEEVVQAALDLRAKSLLPVHWGKFAMANHDWNEPLLRVAEAAKKGSMPLITPLIGEAVDLKRTVPLTSRWLEL